MMAAYEAARPRILGALLDAVSTALRDLPMVNLPCLPRMADFAVWATAAEDGLRWPTGTFMEAYHGNRESANEVALEASPIARPLLDVLEEKVKKAADLVKKLRKDNKSLDEQLKDNKAKLADAEKKLARR